jgi:hypothetical protein
MMPGPHTLPTALPLRLLDLEHDLLEERRAGAAPLVREPKPRRKVAIKPQIVPGLYGPGYYLLSRAPVKCLRAR